MTYCHIFESVKNHLNANISRPIREKRENLYDMYLYDKNMVTYTKLKYAFSLSNYFVVMMLQNLEKKNLFRKFPIFSAFPSHEVPS